MIQFISIALLLCKGALSLRSAACLSIRMVQIRLWLQQMRWRAW